MKRLLKLDNGAVVDLKMVTNIGPVYGGSQRYTVHMLGGFVLELDGGDMPHKEFVERWESVISDSNELLLG